MNAALMLSPRGQKILAEIREFVHAETVCNVRITNADEAQSAMALWNELQKHLRRVEAQTRDEIAPYKERIELIRQPLTEMQSLIRDRQATLTMAVSVYKREEQERIARAIKDARECAQRERALLEQQSKTAADRARMWAEIAAQTYEAAATETDPVKKSALMTRAEEARKYADEANANVSESIAKSQVPLVVPPIPAAVAKPIRGMRTVKEYAVEIVDIKALVTAAAADYGRYGHYLQPVEAALKEVCKRTEGQAEVPGVRFHVGEKVTGTGR